MTARMEEAASARAGLHDGFLEYATPTPEEYRTALRNGLVVVDTNVLLNLYRYHPPAREDLVRILDALGDRLFVPHQVAAEFWKNRESTIRASAGQTTQLRTELEALRSRSLQSIASWANRVALPPETGDVLTAPLVGGYDEVFSRLELANSQSTSLDSLNTNDDPVLARLTLLLDGRVGPPLTDAVRDAAQAEAERRIDEELPPGFGDSEKPAPDRYGDYVLWKQLLDEAAARRRDVLLVTGDVKEDWWRREAGETRGPRLELSRELAAVAGVRLFMMRPAGLFAQAQDALDLHIKEESVRAAETVDRLATRLRPSDGRYPIEKLPDGRSGSYLDGVIEMTSLAEGSPSVEDYLDLFQLRFPTISRRDVARRRMSGIIGSLGLVEIRGGQVTLTDLGHRLLDERRMEILQDAFMLRIAGAPEIQDLARSMPLSTLRADLRDEPPAGLTQTQAVLVLRWLEQLEMT